MSTDTIEAVPRKRVDPEQVRVVVDILLSCRWTPGHTKLLKAEGNARFLQARESAEAMLAQPTLKGRLEPFEVMLLERFVEKHSQRGPEPKTEERYDASQKLWMTVEMRDAIDEAVVRGHYSSRNHLIREAIRRMLDE